MPKGPDSVRCQPSGKIVYMTRDNAKAALRKVRTVYQRDGREGDLRRLHVYECPHCSFWHLGRRKEDAA